MNISDMYSEDILNGSVYMHTHSLNTQNMISWIYIYICMHNTQQKLHLHIKNNNCEYVYGSFIGFSSTNKPWGIYFE